MPIEFEIINREVRPCLPRACGKCYTERSVVLLWHVTGQSSGLCFKCSLALANDLIVKAEAGARLAQKQNPTPREG